MASDSATGPERPYGNTRARLELVPDEVKGEEKFARTMMIAFDEYVAELLGEDDPERALTGAGFTACAEALATLRRSGGR